MVFSYDLLVFFLLFYFFFLFFCLFFVFFQAEDGIRDLVRSRGLGDVYKRQVKDGMFVHRDFKKGQMARDMTLFVDEDGTAYHIPVSYTHLTLPTSDLV